MEQRRIVGQKASFMLKDVWALRVRLQIANPTRELTLFDLGVDSKLRACDLVRLKRIIATIEHFIFSASPVTSPVGSTPRIKGRTM